MIKSAKKTQGRIDQALACVKRGWSITPLKGKKPYITGWQTKPKTLEKTARGYADQGNYGVRTGKLSDLVVVDADMKNGGVQNFHSLNLPRTPTVQTGGGGLHAYFKRPFNGLGCSTSNLAPGIDVKGDGGQVVGPGSIHPDTGKPYFWLIHPDECLLAELPQHSIDKLNESESKTNGSQPLDDELFKGSRNAKLASLAGFMRQKGMKQKELYAVLSEINKTRCKPPLPDKEVRAIAKSVSRYKVSNILIITDAENAERFAKKYKDQSVYCYERGWFNYLEGRWTLDTTGKTIFLGKELIRELYPLTQSIKLAKKRIEVAKLIQKCESEPRLKAMVSLAKSEPGMTRSINQFDADPWLFNCANGTLDLRTGILKPHDRKDLLTKISLVQYEEKAICPTFDVFLARIMDGNDSLITFLQKMVGYCLSGNASEQCLFMAYGSGSNGKSVLAKTVLNLIGDYGKVTDLSTFLARGYDRIPNDVAGLVGTRFVVASEAERGRKLAEVLVKQLTGGDKISARFLHKEYFEYEPNFKIFLTVNHKPTIRGTDHAIWRRIRLIPFMITIPDEEQDKELAEKLKTELPGILRWAMEGCLLWQKEGLGIPDEVADATAEYREEMDILGVFIEDRCLKGTNEMVSTGDLFKAYQEWSESMGDSKRYVLNQRSLGLNLKERGFKPDRNAGGRFWRCLSLKTMTHDA